MQYGNTGTSTLNKMYTTALIHSTCVELNANVNFQHAALQLSVDSEFLLSGRLFLRIYAFNDICCHLYVVKMAIISTRPIANRCHNFFSMMSFS